VWKFPKISDTSGQFWINQFWLCPFEQDKNSVFPKNLGRFFSQDMQRNVSAKERPVLCIICPRNIWSRIPFPEFIRYPLATKIDLFKVQFGFYTETRCAFLLDWPLELDGIFISLVPLWCIKCNPILPHISFRDKNKTIISCNSMKIHFLPSFLPLILLRFSLRVP